MFTVRPHPPQGSLVGTLHFSRWCGGGLRRPFSRAVSSPLGLSLYFCLSTFVYAFPGYLRSRPIGRGALFFCLRFGRPSRVGGSAASYSRFFSAPRRAVALVLLRFPFFPSPRVLLFGPSFLFVPSFPLGTPFILVSSPVLFSASWYIFFVWSFFISCRPVSLYFFIYFYLFRFVRLKDCGRGG